MDITDILCVLVHCIIHTTTSCLAVKNCSHYTLKHDGRQLRRCNSESVLCTSFATTAQPQHFGETTPTTAVLDDNHTTDYYSTSLKCSAASAPKRHTELYTTALPTLPSTRRISIHQQPTAAQGTSFACGELRISEHTRKAIEIDAGNRFIQSIITDAPADIDFVDLLQDVEFDYSINTSFQLTIPQSMHINEYFLEQLAGNKALQRRVGLAELLVAQLPSRPVVGKDLYILYVPQPDKQHVQAQCSKGEHIEAHLIYATSAAHGKGVKITYSIPKHKPSPLYVKARISNKLWVLATMSSAYGSVSLKVQHGPLPCIYVPYHHWDLGPVAS